MLRTWTPSVVLAPFGPPSLHHVGRPHAYHANSRVMQVAGGGCAGVSTNGGEGTGRGMGPFDMTDSRPLGIPRAWRMTAQTLDGWGNAER